MVTPRISPRLARAFVILLAVSVFASLPSAYGYTQPLAAGKIVYLPLVSRTACQIETLPRINAPGFNGSIPYEQTAIAWFGKVTPSQNYADIRVGYNATEIYVTLNIIDRLLWNTSNPTPQTLTEWDTVTVLLDTSGGGTQSSTSWRFVAQLSKAAAPQYYAVYRGSASGWQLSNVPFSAIPGWRGNDLNDTVDDRGWVMGFGIPYSSLGLSSAPAKGSTWRMAVILHDRDSAAGPPVGDQYWPAMATKDSPSCWGILNFGLPTYASTATPSGSVSIRRPTQNSPLVPDADVGGAILNQCPWNEYHIWNEWGNLNYGHSTNFNIQNQLDIADWPCFSKYYVTFPLSDVPSGRIIVSAKLTLYQFGNAGAGGNPQRSWIQALTASGDWQETGVTWNNAPLAYENVTGTWVNVLTSFPNWPGVAYTWDVSYAAAKAYQRGEPLRLVLYDADGAADSGKYFSASDTEDWNVNGRPRLDVVWGEAK